MKILTFTRFAINSFVAFVLSVASLSFQAEASQGQTVFIPIAVGDITTFIPIMPSSSTGSVTSTTTDGSYNLNWSAVTNASYYQIIITDEDGKKRIIKVFGTSYDLAGLSLGSNTIEVQACNANHQCGVGYLAGTVSRSSKVTYQHTDMLGTPVMETDVAGQVVSRSVYEPFGKRLGGEKTGIGYTGHLQDEDLGLTYMQARYYDPLIGRFYSNDPVGFTGEVDTFNRYSYVANNPYKYTDPNGQSKRRLRNQAKEARENNQIAEVAGEALVNILPEGAVKDFIQENVNVIKANNRRGALKKGQQHAQVPRKSKGGEDIPMNELNHSSRGKNYNKIKESGGTNLGRRDTNSKSSVMDHPDGHNDNNATHHESPHVHATNKKGDSIIIEYENE